MSEPEQMLAKKKMAALLVGALFFSTYVFSVEKLANMFLVQCSFPLQREIMVYGLYVAAALVGSLLALVPQRVTASGSIRNRPYLQSLAWTLWTLLGWFLFLYVFARIDARLERYGAPGKVVGAATILLSFVGLCWFLNYVLGRLVRDETTFLASSLSLAVTLMLVTNVGLKVVLQIGGVRERLNPFSSNFNPFAREMMKWEMYFFLLGIAVFVLQFYLLKKWLQRHPEHTLARGSGAEHRSFRGTRTWQVASSVGAGLALLVIMVISLRIACTQIGAQKPIHTPSDSKNNFNVLLIVVDALRASHLPQYGYERTTFPVLETLPNTVVFFKRCVTSSSWTSPSVASMVTSLYPSQHGVLSFGQQLMDESLTLAEILHQHGYTTACFSANTLVSPLFNFDQGYDYFPEFRPSVRYNLVKALMSFGLWNYLDRLGLIEGGYFFPRLEQMNAFLLPWLDQHKTENFFAYVHTMDVHAPYMPSRRHFSSKFRGTRQPDWKFAKMIRNGTALDVSEEERQDVMNRYDDEMLYTSGELQKILDKLRELELDDRTIVIFTADHGEEFWEHGSVAHSHTLYNELVIVPLVFAVPSALPHESRVTDTAVRSVDLLPTILHLLRIPMEPAWQFSGVNLLSLKEGDDHNSLSGSPNEAILEMEGKKGIIRDDMKLIVSEKDGEITRELYNIADDPGEKVNLYETRPDVARPLEESLEAYLATAREQGIAATETEIDAGLKGQLKALGYLQ